MLRVKSLKEQELRLIEQPLYDEIPSVAIERDGVSPASVTLSSVKPEDEETLKTYKLALTHILLRRRILSS